MNSLFPATFLKLPFRPKYIIVILVPAMNMNRVNIIMIYGEEKAAIPLLRVEKPPVDRVDNE
jgi:hypothetical protein